MELVKVRYIVDNVDNAIAFYCNHLGFEVESHPAPGFASLHKDNLRLLLNTPGAGGAGRAGSETAAPQPGGWNRFQLAVTHLDEVVARLREAGIGFRSGIVTGKGGRQALVTDPAGNVVELFEPHQTHSGEARSIRPAV